MAQKKALIIDDDDSILDIMQIIISDMGLETFAFASWTSETIQSIITIKPDIIFLDEWLVGIRGSEICIILKSINQLRTVPIILVSGAQDLAQVAKKALADGYIHKPFEITDIEKMVGRFSPTYN